MKFCKYEIIKLKIIEEEARQMLFDIESSYGAFNQFLKST